MSRNGIDQKTLGLSGHSWNRPNIRAPLLRGISWASAPRTAADERLHATVLRMEAVRADVEVKIAVVKGSRKAADHRVLLNDGCAETLAGKLVRDGQAGDAGPDDGHCLHEMVNPVSGPRTHSRCPAGTRA